MNERIQTNPAAETDGSLDDVLYEYEGYTGRARMLTSEPEMVTWRVSIGGGAEQICYYDVTKNGTDHSRAVEEDIQRTITQFLWDPMSQA